MNEPRGGSAGRADMIPGALETATGPAAVLSSSSDAPTPAAAERAADVSSQQAGTPEQVGQMWDAVAQVMGDLEELLAAMRNAPGIPGHVKGGLGVAVKGMSRIRVQIAEAGAADRRMYRRCRAALARLGVSDAFDAELARIVEVETAGL